MDSPVSITEAPTSELCSTNSLVPEIEINNIVIKTEKEDLPAILDNASFEVLECTELNIKEEVFQQCGPAVRIRRDFGNIRRRMIHMKVCDKCGYSCRLAKQMKKHKAKHKKHQCDICVYQTNRISHFRWHLIKHTHELPFSCDKCRMRFASNLKLMRHKRTHTAERPHQCPKCSRAFLERYNLKAHMRVHSKSKPYKCHICPFSTRHKNNLANHILTHTNERNYSCDQCNFICIAYTSLCRHKKTHTNERPFHCADCPFKAKTRRDIIRHVSRHINNIPHACDQCDFTTFESNTLKKHIECHLNKPYRCQKCTAKFKSKNDLILHKRKHKFDYLKMKVYQCHLCSFKCTARTAMSNHLSFHEGRDKNRAHMKVAYSCKTCDIQFANRLDYNTHKMEHLAGDSALLSDKLGMPPSIEEFSCKICDFKGSKLSFVQHMTEHLLHDEGTEYITNEQGLLNCDACDTGSESLLDFINHVIECHPDENEQSVLDDTTLNDAEVYKCKICSFEGITAPSLKLHMLEHDPATREAVIRKLNIIDRVRKIYKCKVCSYKGTEAMLTLHMKQHNPNLSVQDKLDKYFRCNMCNSKYTLEQDLINHKEIHQFTEEVPSSSLFVCDYCLYKGLSKRSLIYHMRIHRPNYKLANAKKRMMRRTGKKSFGCNLCFYIGKKETMNKHFKMYHSQHLNKKSPGKVIVKTLDCQVCSSKFTDLHSFETHLKEHNSVVLNDEEYFSHDVDEFAHDVNNSVLGASNDIKLEVSFDDNPTSTNDLAVNLDGPVSHLNVSQNDDDQRSESSSMRECHKPPSMNCNICSKEFFSQNILIEHVKTHENIEDHSILKECLFQNLNSNFEDKFAPCISAQTDTDIVFEKEPSDENVSSLVVTDDKFPNCDNKSLKISQDACSADVQNNTLDHVEHIDSKDNEDVIFVDITYGSDVKFKCEVCFFRGNSQGDLNRHMKVHEVSQVTPVTKKKAADDVSGSFQCTVCPFVGRTKYGLRNHMRIHTASLKQEFRTISPSPEEDLQLFRCKVCSFKGKSRSSLVDHMKSHSDSVSKEECDKIPQRSEESGNPFSCLLCPFEGSSVMDFENHNNIIHPSNTIRLPSDSRLLFPCQSCSFEGYSKRGLANHMRIHTGCPPKQNCDTISQCSDESVQSFQCPLCTFEVNSRQGIANHMRIHLVPNGEDDLTEQASKESLLKSFKCKVCSFSGSTLIGLANHMDQHKSKDSHANSSNLVPKTDSMKLFKCNLCSFEAITEYSLTNHMTTHKSTSKQPLSKSSKVENFGSFKCHVCSFNGITQYSLTNHLKTHETTLEYDSESSVYTCSICRTSFNKMNAFVLHKKKHLPKAAPKPKVFQCHVCPFTAQSQSSLINHMKVHKLPLLCDDCCMVFKTEEAFVRHYLTHQ